MKTPALFVALLAACGPTPTVDLPCHAGDEVTCACADDASGTQVCGDDGAWTPCACAPLPAFIGTWTAAPVSGAYDVEAFYAPGTWTQTSIVPDALPAALPGCTLTTTAGGTWRDLGLGGVLLTTASQLTTRDGCDDARQDGTTDDPASRGVTHTYRWSVAGDTLTLTLTDVNTTPISGAHTETLERYSP